MKRADALVAIRVAGYHGDQKTYMRLYCEHRISHEKAQAEYQKGADMKKAGVKCACPDCNRKPT